MKNKEKLRPFDEPLFYSIGKRRPEIMEEFLRLILNDDTLAVSYTHLTLPTKA